MTINDSNGVSTAQGPRQGELAPDGRPRAGVARGEGRAVEEVRRAAAHFEALLLTQMTSRLNASSDDEGGLFGSDDAGATALYRQLFSEQLASTMAEGGGVGIAEMMLAQMGVAAPAAPSSRGLARAFEASRDLLSAGGRTSPAATRLERHAPAPGAAGAEPDPTGDVYLVSEAADPVGAAEPARLTAPRGIPEGVDLRPANAVRPRRVTADNIVFNAPAADTAAAARESRPEKPAPSSVPPAGRDFSHPLPIEGRLSARFGFRRDPFTGERRFHEGMDIAAPRGTPIAAVADGTVLFAGRLRGYGRTVVIEHGNGLRTRYAHAESLDVRTGERVTRGQIIAAVGSTGRSTGPHLHFEVTENGHPVEPSTFFAKAPKPSRR